MKTACVLTAMLFILAASIAASITPTINYQGRLTDDTGAPVADGTYQIVFSIYNTETSSTAAWTSGKQDITVSGGLFTYKLGSNVPFSNKLFAYESRWLGIKVGNDAEISPRTLIQSVPYAYTAAKADTALFVDNEDDFVHTAGDTMEGELYIDGDDDGYTDIELKTTSNAGRLILRDDGAPNVYLMGNDYGQFSMSYTEDGITSTDMRAYPDGGWMLLSGPSEASWIEFDSGEEGDNTVRIPNNSVNSNEILNEMGFATNRSSTVVILNSTEMTSIASISIKAPAPGYVRLSGSCNVRLYATTGANGAYVQIDYTAGGEATSPHYTYIYQNAFPDISSYYYSASCERVYYLGDTLTYTFYLEAKTANLATGSASTYRPILTALYIPTSYGTVGSTVAENSGFENAVPVTVQDENGQTSTVYEVDLRELELKAQQAKIATQEAYIEQLKAERELEQAKREAE
ncbi:MAG: hypothetical protein R3F48_00805 [Candidatus Zixiibacteriota bacterium]